MRVLLLWLFFPFSLVAQNNFTAGKIIDSIPVENTIDETFSLYLPTSFNKEKLSSIIFVFEPAARGSIGVAPFLEVSEKYGYIVVCSNNSKNGPQDINFKIANRLFSHVFKVFSVDEKQMYLAGFSGGSRLVSSIAILTGNFSGVIACGAGLSGNSIYSSYINSKKNFNYVGICGDEDMNYKEMVANSKFLKKIGLENTLYTFNGGHHWPSKKEINRAFRWLLMQKSLEEFREMEIEDARLFHETQNYLMSAENYERIIDSYRNSNDASKIQEEYSLLLKSKEYKNQLKDREKAFNLETSLSEKLLGRFILEIEEPAKVNMGWWNKEVKKLDKFVNGSSEESKMVKRVKFKVFASAFARGNPNLHDSNEQQLAYCEKLKQIIYPR